MQTKSLLHRLFKGFSKGFSLVEMLIYAALLTMILLAVLNVVFSFTSSYQQLGALRVAEHSGITSMERMIRDIHSAVTIDAANSTLGSHPGVLQIMTNSTTTKFYLQNGVLSLDVNGEYIGPLTAKNASTTSLIFTRITTDNSEAIKIDMTVQGAQGRALKNKSYHATVILKKS